MTSIIVAYAAKHYSFTRGDVNLTLNSFILLLFSHLTKGALMAVWYRVLDLRSSGGAIYRQGTNHFRSGPTSGITIRPREEAKKIKLDYTLKFLIC